MLTKRAYLTEKGNFTIKEIDLHPEADEVLVKVALCGLCNWELNFWKSNGGMYSEYPALLGHEWSGVVIETGENVTKFKPGDKITAFDFGGFGEYNVAKESMCCKIEPDVKYENAMGEPIKCISTVLTAASPRVGDTGVILGCGAMGQWCIQTLGRSSLSHLIAVDIDDKKLEIAKKHGATHTINSKNEDAAKRISEITGGCMADFVIEGTGVPEVLEQGAEFLRTQGRLILMSSHERSAKEFNLTPIFMKGITLIGAGPARSDNADEDLKRACAFINKGIIDNQLLISHKYELSEINEAFAALENKPSDYIKGIVVCNKDMLC